MFPKSIQEKQPSGAIEMGKFEFKCGVASKKFKYPNKKVSVVMSRSLLK